MFDYPHCFIRVVFSVRSMKTDISSSCRRRYVLPVPRLFQEDMRARLEGHQHGHELDGRLKRFISASLVIAPTRSQTDHDPRLLKVQG